MVACCCLLQVHGFMRTATVGRSRISVCPTTRTSSVIPAVPASLKYSRNDPPISSLVNVPGFRVAPTEEDIIELEENQRVVCLGDVHGDLQGLKDFLEIAGVYKDDTWVGKNTILVQCGDVLDRGSEELACMKLLAKMSNEAKQQGGKVILLFGNHESMNAMGLFQYAVSDVEYEQVLGPIVDGELGTQNWRVQYVGNQPARWATYEPGGLLASSFMANMKMAVKVGRTVCVHAGLTAQHLEDYGGIEGMNRQAKEWFTSNTTNVIYNNKGEYTSLRDPWIEAEARQTSYINSLPPFLNGGGISPIWMRDYSSPNDLPPRNPKAQSMIDAALEKVDCDRMVMGHSVQRQINSALNGKAWRIDIGVSRGVMAGEPEVLEIVKTNGREIVSVLTRQGKVPAEEREVPELAVPELTVTGASPSSPTARAILEVDI